jgi:phosphoesterase RecJ-like protein
VHRLAAEFIEKGVSPAKIWRELHCGQPLSKLQLLGSALAGIQTDCGGKLAWSLADKDVMKQLGVVPRDAFEIVNYLLRVRGVEVGVFFFPVDETRTKVSLRSAGRVDVCELAERHGGGGHKFASGCTVEGMAPAAAVVHVLDNLKACIETLIAKDDQC